MAKFESRKRAPRSKPKLPPETLEKIRIAIGANSVTSLESSSTPGSMGAFGRLEEVKEIQRQHTEEAKKDEDKR